MRRGRLVAGAVCLLVAVALVPAVSAAQDPGVAVDPTAIPPTTTTTPTPLPPVPTDTGGAPKKVEAPPAPTGSSSDAVADAPETTPPADTGAATDRLAQAAASASVTMGDFFFSPSSVTVAVGDTVTWHNTGQAPHNAVGDGGSFTTPTVNNGGSSSHTFSTAGTFSYICTIHPQMKGTVRVLAASGGGGGSSGSSGSGSSGSTLSEQAAVTSPDAAGDANTLPMTGFAAGALALVGVALLASGLALRERAGKRFRLPLL